jgi:hypothetical protein
MTKQIILGFVLPISMGAIVAFVPNGIIWLLFGLGCALIGLTLYSLVFRAIGRPAWIYRDAQPPWWFDATLTGVGAILVISAAPGLFFGQPTWAIDHVYRAISVVLGSAA